MANQVDRDSLLIELQQASALDFDMCLDILDACNYDREKAYESASMLAGHEVLPPERRNRRQAADYDWEEEENSMEVDDEDERAPIPIHPTVYEPLGSPPDEFHDAREHWGAIPREGSPNTENVDNDNELLLTVIWEDMEFPLTMRPSDTIGQVKEKLADQTGIDVRQMNIYANTIQNPHNKTLLSNLNLPRESRAMLVVDPDVPPAPPARPANQQRRSPARVASESDGSDAEYILDEFRNNPWQAPPPPQQQFPPAFMPPVFQPQHPGFRPQRPPRQSQPAAPARNTRPSMMPADEDASVSVAIFNDNFAGRYAPGKETIAFFPGTLHEAAADARRNCKLLFVYIHDDAAIESNVFCKNVLCSKEVVDIVKAQYKAWAWDVSLPRNRRRLQEMAGQTPEYYPLTMGRRNPAPILAVYAVRNTGIRLVDLKEFMYKEDFVNWLLTIENREGPDLMAHQAEEQMNEVQRLQRTQELDEQDRAYRESLEADREKERIKREEERRRQEEEEIKLAEEASAREAEEEEERRRIREEEEAKRLQEELSRKVLAEPPEDCSEPISTLRFRCPDKVVDRRFLTDTATIQDVLTYCGSIGYPEDKYRLVLSFPRQVLGGPQLQKGMTLKEAKLTKSVAVNIEPV
eukprot:comp11948_c0_seq1/m.6623 comp11948_c0_seq1/g.6623  ORF comp11948_c0_seq1/g.6623 comp11948_c0_seq1/m.6623 type:complete len:636 (-) comp11948_c0_seq1:233-2140(-)